MNKIVDELVDHIEKTEKETGEISLFSWSHSLKAFLNIHHGIVGIEARVLSVEAYNRTHPHSPYEIKAW